MDFDEYRRNYFAHPAPTPPFEVAGLRGVTLYVREFERAVAFYEKVLGPAAYVEGGNTRGWRLGDGWLTLLRDRLADSRYVEVTLRTPTSAEADRLREAFMAAGGNATEPTDTIHYEPVRLSHVTDPFGTRWLIVAPRG